LSNIKNIFLIDDDETFVFLTGRIIKATQKVDSVKTFGNGKDAIDYLSENASKPELLPEIIFFDLNMPILDGWGFIEEFITLMPKLAKQIKLYIITSSIAVHDIEKSKNFSVISDYMIKPVLKEKFVEIVESYSVS
jgi:response regulator of citrate/malate metabolism